MRGMDFSKQDNRYADENKLIWKEQGTYIADIEKFKVLQYGKYYSLWDSDQLVGFCSLMNSIVDDAYVDEEYRGQKIFSLMLWFFKTRLDHDQLIIGSVHSPMMQEVVKGLSRFEKFWINLETNEKIAFDPVNVDEYYSYLMPTKWRLVLENTGEFNWPMFNSDGFVKESYYPYID